jgi:methylenetetrahydrofolate reductase (NADPH)
MQTQSVLERMFRAGHLAVTSECGPPRGALPDKVREKAGMLRGFVDAVNVTDNQTAMVRMSSLAACIIIRQMGLHPVLQMVTRDRNRLALQSDLLGAFAFDINTMLCLSGDHPHFGDHPEAANVYDLDSVQLIQTVRRMREEGKFQGGQEIANPPKMFIGAAANPFADPFELRVRRLAKKAEAGADFVQTQCIYNIDKFERWMEGVCKRRLHEKVFVMAGITPLKSVGMARYMQKKVPGMDVPEEMVNRLAALPKDKQAEEGITMAVESIDRLKKIEGVRGIHLMAIEWEHRVPEIVRRAGLYPRPEV